MNDQNRKVALITGASRGLGLALGRALAERGWGLIIDGRGVEALNQARHELKARTRVVAIPGDIAEAAHRHTLAEAAAALGGIDALVNNASNLGPSRTCWRTRSRSWRRSTGSMSWRPWGCCKPFNAR